MFRIPTEESIDVLKYKNCKTRQFDGDLPTYEEQNKQI